MGSIAKKFVSRSLMLALFLSLGSLALPVSPSAQDSPEGVILEQELKEATRVLQQHQREAAWAQKRAKAQRVMAGDFQMILLKTKAQHAMIEEWQKAHSIELKIKARGGVHKRRLHCRICS
jgi:hypothetical protein